MQFSITVRLFDVIAFYIDSMTREFSALKILGTASTLVIAILVQAYIRGGTDILIQAAMISAAAAVTCVALFYGAIALMAIANRDENQPTGEIAYEISPSGVVIRSSRGLSRYSWDDITSIGHSDNFAWIHVDDRHYRFVPRKALASDEQFTAVRAALENSRHAD